MNWRVLLVTTFLFQVEIGAITHSTKDKDELNLNTIQNGHQDQNQHKMNQKEANKDGIEDATQEKRTFFQPQADRKGTFYPSGPNFAVGTGINVGNTAYIPNYYTSGNGYSYGAPGSPDNYPTGQPTGPNTAQGESSFSERNHNFGQNNPSFGYGVPNLGHSGYGVPSVGHSSGGGFGIPTVGHSSGGGFGIPTVGHSSGGGYGIPTVGHSSGGGYGLMPQHGGGGAQHPLKGLIIPIAGFALLGAAAVLAKSHPVLLQLGVIHGRKKRSVYPVNPFISPDKS